jgi:hypothetical protein
MLFLEKTFPPVEEIMFAVAFLVLLLEVGANYIGFLELALSTLGFNPARAIIWEVWSSAAIIILAFLIAMPCGCEVIGLCCG